MGLGEGIGHSLSRSPLDFSDEHPQRPTALSGWAITSEWQTLDLLRVLGKGIVLSGCEQVSEVKWLSGG